MSRGPQRLALCLLGLGLIVALVVFVLPWPVESTPVQDPEESATGRASAARPTPGADTPTDELHPSTREPSPRQPLQGDPAHRIEVVVVRRGTRTAVAGASAATCDLDALIAAFRARVPPPDRTERSEIFERLAWRATAGNDGKVMLPRLGAKQLIHVTHASGLWGRCLLSGSPTGPVEIAVDRDYTLRAQVLSATDHRPVEGVPVALLSGGTRPSAVQPTRGGDAIATFPHVQATMREQPGWRLGFGFPLRERADVAVALEDLPGEPVTLMLPATGSLAVRVRDEDGRAVSGEEVRLDVKVYATVERVRELTLGEVVSPHVDAGGNARVAFLGTELALRVVATPRDPASLHRPVHVDVEGPRHAGETIECEVPWRSSADTASSYPVVTGRFVRRDGSPWPAAEIGAYPSIFPHPREHIATAKITVAVDGTFRLALRHPCPTGGRRIFRLTCTAPSDLAGIEGRLDLSRTMPPGETRLGDVVLDHGTLLAAGTVVDQDGEPLSEARVDLVQLVLENGREFWPTYDCAGRFRLSDGGAFALHAIPGRELPTSRLRLHARCEGFATARDLDIALGQRGLRIVLARGGAIAGSVRFEEGQDASDIAVVLSSGERSWFPPLRPDGSFEQDELPAVSLTLKAYLRAVSYSEHQESRVTVENLQIVSGETNRDPRIQNLSIHGSATKLTFRVRDELGTPIARAAIETPDYVYTLTDRDGVAVLRPSELPANVRVTAFGYREVHLAGIAEDREVVLSKGVHVRLETGAKPIGLDPAYHLGFFLYQVGEHGQRRLVWGRNMPYDRMYFDERGEALLPMPGPGTYLVEPRVYVDSKDNVGRGGTLGLKPPPRITVRDTDELQTFRIVIPPDLLQATVQRFVR